MRVPLLLAFLAVFAFSVTFAAQPKAFRDILVRTCDNHVHAFSQHPILRSGINGTVLDEAYKAIISEIRRATKCHCSTMSDSDIQDHFIPDFGTLLRNWETLSYENFGECTFAGSLKQHLQKFRIGLPASCRAADYEAGKPCMLELDIPTYFTAQLTIQKCSPTSTGLPYISIACKGDMCGSLFQPCTLSSECGNTGLTCDHVFDPSDGSPSERIMNMLTDWNFWDAGDARTNSMGITMVDAIKSFASCKLGTAAASPGTNIMKMCGLKKFATNSSLEVSTTLQNVIEPLVMAFYPPLAFGSLSSFVAESLGLLADAFNKATPLRNGVRVYLSQYVRAWNGTFEDGASAIEPGRISGANFISAKPITVPTMPNSMTIFHIDCNGKYTILPGEKVNMQGYLPFAHEMISQLWNVVTEMIASRSSPSLSKQQMRARFNVFTPEFWMNMFTTYSGTVNQGAPFSSFLSIVKDWLGNPSFSLTSLPELYQLKRWMDGEVNYISLSFPDLATLFGFGTEDMKIHVQLQRCVSTPDALPQITVNCLGAGCKEIARVWETPFCQENSDCPNNRRCLSLTPLSSPVNLGSLLWNAKTKESRRYRVYDIDPSLTPQQWKNSLEAYIQTERNCYGVSGVDYTRQIVYPPGFFNYPSSGWQAMGIDIEVYAPIYHIDGIMSGGYQYNYYCYMYNNGGYSQMTVPYPSGQFFPMGSGTPTGLCDGGVLYSPECVDKCFNDETFTFTTLNFIKKYVNLPQDQMPESRRQGPFKYCETKIETALTETNWNAWKSTAYSQTSDLVVIHRLKNDFIPRLVPDLEPISDLQCISPNAPELEYPSYQLALDSLSFTPNHLYPSPSSPPFSPLYTFSPSSSPFRLLLDHSVTKVIPLFSTNSGAFCEVTAFGGSAKGINTAPLKLVNSFTEIKLGYGINNVSVVCKSKDKQRESAAQVFTIVRYTDQVPPPFPAALALSQISPSATSPLSLSPAFNPINANLYTATASNTATSVSLSLILSSEKVSCEVTEGRTGKARSFKYSSSSINIYNVQAGANLLMIQCSSSEAAEKMMYKVVINKAYDSRIADQILSLFTFNMTLKGKVLETKADKEFFLDALAQALNLPRAQLFIASVSFSTASSLISARMIRYSKQAHTQAGGDYLTTVAVGIQPKNSSSVGMEPWEILDKLQTATEVYKNSPAASPLSSIPAQYSISSASSFAAATFVPGYVLCADGQYVLESRGCPQPLPSDSSSSSSGSSTAIGVGVGVGVGVLVVIIIVGVCVCKKKGGNKKPSESFENNGLEMKNRY